MFLHFIAEPLKDSVNTLNVPCNIPLGLGSDDVDCMVSCGLLLASAGNFIMSYKSCQRSPFITGKLRSRGRGLTPTRPPDLFTCSTVRPVILCAFVKSFNSRKTQLMKEQTVLSLISLSHIVIFMDCFKIVQKARKVFSADAHMWNKVQDLITQKEWVLMRRGAFCKRVWSELVLFVPP